MKQNVLDEREQQVLGQIEHKALNAAEILLILAIVVQLLLGADFRQIAGECMVMIVLTIGMIAAYVHSGIWDTDAAPSSGGNLRFSLFTGAGAGLLTFGLKKNILFALAMALGMFILTFVLLTFLMNSVRRRQEKQAEELEADE